jgi:hypothetical protein
MKFGRVVSLACLMATVLLFSKPSFAQFNCLTNGTISLSPSSINFSTGAAGSGGFAVTLSQTCGYAASTLQSWIHPSPSGLSIPFSIDANPDLCSRSGAIKAQITQNGSNGASASGTIIQAASAGDFSLSVSPSTQTLVQGGAVTFKVTVTRTGGFNGNVAFNTPTGLPAGVTATYSNATFSSATLTLSATANASVGTFPVTVPGVNSCQQRNASPINIQVIALPQQAGYYIGSDQHVYESVLANGVWGNNDLTVITNNIAASATSGLTSFKNGSLHSVYFVGTNQRVYQLTWATGVWTSTDLTAVSGTGSVPVTNSPLTSYTSTGAGHSVYYLGADQHIHELNFNGTSWHDGDLTIASGAGILPATTTALTAFIASSGGISVYYVGTNQHLYELNFNLTRWNNGDLTAAGAGPLALLGTGLSSFMASSGGISVYYVSTNQHLHEMNFNRSVWHDGDLTAASGTGTIALSSTAVTSFQASSGGISVYYKGTDLHVHEMNFNLTAWHDGDVTAVTGGTLASNSGGMSSFIAAATGGISVFYLSGAGHFDDLNFNGSVWNNGDLTMITGGAAPIGGSAVTAFVQQ